MKRQGDHLRHPLKVARGLGSAKDGTGHFIIQRITAIALFFLGLYLVGLLVSGGLADFATARGIVGHPLHATLLTAFLVAMFWHTQLGIQVIIEDYVHTPGWAVFLQLANRFICILAAIASVLAVIRIALGA
ncbi:succinate dehydrogenase, hydrophobic membrane anchor protein [Lysobacter sp. GX 14042]|uniref:succinate dehydrogenase, hydrophobic membrane anchor protein n=1 Tax=Lysobacter sp. GX 14042 TaxID=2907155 RepID=UPI001F468F42|nr:succinate dehydrogenase, hydrophobic membrane anchor protein [Lysobacter sp. GX 14042]MCE7031514.1 succinate dehydrogenase, hydrophobic membrane anchor protein [Lysobacter sp. GX 14042]